MVWWDMMVSVGTYMGFPWTVPPVLHGTVGYCGLTLGQWIPMDNPTCSMVQWDSQLGTMDSDVKLGHECPWKPWNWPFICPPNNQMTSQQWAHDCFHSNHIVESAKTIVACFLWARGWGMEWRQTSKGENGMKAGEWNEDKNGLNAGLLYSRNTCKIRSLFFFTALTVALHSPILHSRTKS